MTLFHLLVSYCQPYRGQHGDPTPKAPDLTYFPDIPLVRCPTMMTPVFNHLLCLFIYYESTKRKLQTKYICGCRCYERLQPNTKEFTRLSYTVLCFDLVRCAKKFTLAGCFLVGCVHLFVFFAKGLYNNEGGLYNNEGAVCAASCGTGCGG